MVGKKHVVKNKQSTDKNNRYIYNNCRIYKETNFKEGTGMIYHDMYEEYLSVRFKTLRQ